MKTTLTPQQIHDYQNDGFLVVRGFLTPDEVAELKSAVTEAVASMGRRKLAGNDEWEEGDAYYDKVFTQRLNLWRINETCRRYMLAPALGEMAATLAGIDGIRVWHDQALIKQPWGNATGWHRDNPYWSFHSPDAISIWIALEDATMENGCMAFQPGTHKDGRFENTDIGPNFGGLFEVYPQYKDIQPVYAPMKAGDCSFHNGLTNHGAGVNNTPGTRMAFTCAYMPEGAFFNGQKNVLPTDYFNSLNVGDVLENDEINPLVWSRD